jgi:uncharacterized protein (DUF433 family)/transposase-like protein
MVSSTLGIGVYSVPEAARMIGMNNQSLYRWLRGYEWRDRDDKARFSEPLWSTQHKITDDGVFLGFRDLVEARVVNALVRKGVSLQTIRLCLDRAQDIVGSDHPLSTKHFKTDGKGIFLQITEGVDEPQLINLKTRQGVFNTVVAPSLSGLEFDEVAARRWLLNNKKTVVADPLQSFGQPVIDEYGITTAALFNAVQAEGSVEVVANLYEIRKSAVLDAIAYESQLSGRSIH